MKKKFLRTAAAGMSALMLMQNVTAYAAWQRDSNGWKYTNEQGTLEKSNWKWIDGNKDGVAECYYFGKDGYMVESGKTPGGYTVDQNGAWTKNGAVQVKNLATGVISSKNNVNALKEAGPGFTSWQKSGNRWWFDMGDGTYCKNCWAWIDGNHDGVAECYYFDKDGWLLTNTTTPDGYTVNADGAWYDETGVRTSGIKANSSDYKAHRNSGGSGRTHSGGSSNSGNHNSNTNNGNNSGNNSGSNGNASNGGNTSATPSNAEVAANSKTKASDDYLNEYYGDLNKDLPNDYKTGNKSVLDDNQKKEVASTVDEIYEYILHDYKVSDQSDDFSKELAIIQYLVENITYENENSDSDDKSTAFGALLYNVASSAGYADAFLALAERYGLDARFVCNSKHAWNLVKLDGEWYHVDVCMEDPDLDWYTWVCYGFDIARNLYINKTDDQIKNMWLHDTWTKDAVKATGTKYGSKAVANKIYADSDCYYRESVSDMYGNAEEDGSLVKVTTVKETASAIEKYIESVISEDREFFSMVLKYDGKSYDGNTYNYYCEMNKKIADEVNEYINWKYGTRLDSVLLLNLHLQVDADCGLYGQIYNMIRYKAPEEKTSTPETPDKKDDTTKATDSNATKATDSNATKNN